jgi:hypothetical protein
MSVEGDGLQPVRGLLIPIRGFRAFSEDEYQSWSGERRVLEQVADVGAQAFGRG